MELMRQVAGIVTTAAKARWGEIQLLVEVVPAAPSWPSAGTFWMQAGEPGPAAMTLEFSLSAALVAELRTVKAETAKTEAVKTEAKKSESAKTESTKSEPAKAETAPAAPPRSAADDAAQSAGTLDLLMDVELAMTMRFGARTLLLREVLDLSPGAVIELDRKVQEPVDLLLGGRLVARGEVVVIEGNYGLRVTDVSPLDPG
jgi:flagellar motor switch protein FliN/FliY